MSIPYTELFVAIGANDFAAAVDFYRALLGREPEERIRDVYVAFHAPGLRLGIFSPRESNRSLFENRAEARGGLSLVMRVPDVEVARAAIALLNPAEPPGEIQPIRGGREFYAFDTEGNRIIVFERDES